MINAAQEGLSFVELDGTFSYVNEAFASLFGYAPQELTGNHWTKLYHQEEADRLENDILPAVYDTGYWSGETVRLTKSGERLVTDHRLALTDSDVIVCTAQDVTGERLARHELCYGDELLLDVVDEHAFYTLDHDGYVTRWNELAEQLTGYSAEEVLCNHWSDLYGDSPGRVEQLLDSAQTDGTVTDSGWHTRSDGSQYWADTRLSASFSEEGVLQGFGAIEQESSPPESA